MIRADEASSRETAPLSELPKKLIPASNMKFEKSSLEVQRSSEKEAAPSISVTEFVLKSLTSNLERETERVPEGLREKAHPLAKSFQKEFVDLLSKQVQNVILTEPQQNYLSSVIMRSVKFSYNGTYGDVDLLK